MTATTETPSVTSDGVDFVHTGPGTLAGRYLRMFWQPVYVSQELKAGYAVPIRILGESFTLYRGASGKPYIVDFRCAHRGTQLSVGWVEDDCIRCFYHGWKYDGAGQCIEQPAENESFAQKITIRSCPTQEYLGLIFAYFGEGVAPPLPGYPELEEDGEIATRNLTSPSSVSTGTFQKSPPRKPTTAWRCTAREQTASRGSTITSCPIFFTSKARRRARKKVGAKRSPGACRWMT